MKMEGKFFIVGTDTGIGKTYITSGLINAFNETGYSTCGLKPVSSGEGLYNEDALELQRCSSISLEYKEVNPFFFPLPISPNIAGKYRNSIITVKNIVPEVNKVLTKYKADFCFIEGVGGWHAPLNDKETMADFAKELNLPVILVVGIRLGCLNHAILTARAINNVGLSVNYWVANCIDPTMSYLEDNIDTLQKYIKSPLLGVIGYKSKPEDILDLKLLI
jgi:dethiobiotin synthetase